jgi:hypothetical protein
MTPLTAYLQGVGLLGPGLADWPAGAAVLTGSTPYVGQPTVLPPPTLLPAAERRRTGTIVKLTLATGLEATSRAGVDPKNLATVFASSGGDGHNCHEICQVLASADRQLSPTRVHNSVHNAAAGYWSIATHSELASNVVCAFDASFAAGLLEALTQVVIEQQDVLLLAYDASYPEPMRSTRPIPDALGVGLVLTRQPGPSSLARLEVSLASGQADRTDDPQLEALRAAIPAARCLPMLQRLARRDWGRTHIEYLEDQVVAVDLFACG